MSFTNYITKIYDRYELLCRNNSGSKVNVEELKEMGKLESCYNMIKKLFKAQTELQDITSMLDDPELKDLAKEEKIRLEKLIPELENEVKLSLIDSDDNEDGSVIIEIRAGSGGDEAALFVGDVARMYQRYSTNIGWKWEVINCSPANVGGYKEMIANIKGKDVYSSLKFESGVHRVQRIPDTEAQGRIHTSAITVAIFLQIKENVIAIEDKDLRIDTYRSQGAGGQHVNTTDSAVRITHLPTNIVVTCQEEKSQHKNKAKALEVLRSKIYFHYQEQERLKKDSMRKNMVGSGDRSERIRTYNFPQNRLTDHRIGMTNYSLDSVMLGTISDLQVYFDALRAHEKAQKIASLDI